MVRDNKGRFVKRIRVRNKMTGRTGTVIIDRAGLCKVQYDDLSFKVWSWSRQLERIN